MKTDRRGFLKLLGLAPIAAALPAAAAPDKTAYMRSLFTGASPADFEAALGSGTIPARAISTVEEWFRSYGVVDFAEVERQREEERKLRDEIALPKEHLTPDA
jgi:hypothetical protein